MLQIKNISKTYKTGDLIQKALNGVSLNLRDNEFVAILGPSGSGKTTLLNIIGGLDRYDSGDLIINNISTKKYKDRDWDRYRNHTIGFVFQSYNLIPHQSVLSNVELALTISGVSRKQRKKRALEALNKVGLKGQEHKKPNQMSGGQMQRVAIARALVNNPDILLADEPTGALDSKTSIQVMDLLKEVAKDRLVVMVTHNPELASEYANRIVKLQDGEIISDTNPYMVVDEETPKTKKIGKAHMGLFTALSLSFNNLLTKKSRTILTAFAGSIGIIGIALILSLSQGFQNYIDKIQEDTMSSYPLTIQSETSSVFQALLSLKVEGENNDEVKDEVHEQMLISSMMNSIGSNDLKSFKKWLSENEDKYKNDVKDITYSYSVSPRIYTLDVKNNYAQLNPSTLMSSIYSDSAASLLSSFSSSTSIGIFSSYSSEEIKEETTLLKGKYPENYDELIIVLSDKNQISDLLVYSLGLRDTKELKTLISQVMSNEKTDIKNDPLTFTYDDLMNIDLRLIDTSDLYKYNATYKTYEDMSDDDEYMKKVYEASKKLKIVGIAESTGEDSLTGVIYLPELTDYVIEKAKESEIVQKQLRNKDVDVFSNNKFDDDEKSDSLDFNDMVSIDEDLLKEAFKVNIDTDSLEDSTLGLSNIQTSMLNETNNIVNKLNSPEVTSDIYKSASGVVTGVYYSVISSKTAEYDLTHSNSGQLTINTTDVNALVADISKSGISNVVKTMNANLVNMFDETDYNNFADDIKECVVEYYSQIDSIATNHVVNYSTSTIENNTISIYSDLTNPTNYKDSVTLITAVIGSKGVHYNELINNFYKRMVVTTSLTTVTTPLFAALESFSSIFDEDLITIDTDKFAEAFNFDMDEDEVSRLMSSMLTSSDASYSNNLINLGYQDFDEPTSISIYFNDFDSKENFLDLLDEYNSDKTEEDKLQYTDITGILMSSVKTIIDSVSYVLIAFVSISLIVSSIMIAVITLISVMERVKEIGILRAMGASKKNVSSIFNAETFIIGLLSGLLGVGVTSALIPPINNLIHSLTNNYDINAILPTNAAIILVLISVVLTMLAGLIPSSKASKQDPVIALRSE